MLPKAMRASRVLLLVCPFLSCGSGTSSPAEGQLVCYDAASKATDACAVTPNGDVCSLGDANSCVVLTRIEVYADDGKNGVCLHLVYQNGCAGTIYADTCIEHKEGSSAASWQCWTSSKPSGSVIDVSQCHATGNYFHVSTASSGQLTILEQKCQAPH